MTWFVMRDLTRANAGYPAWKLLEDHGYRVFTPMVWKLRRKGPRQEKIQIPVIHDLLFVESSRKELDPLVERVATLQYRFRKGGRFGEAMTVGDEEMSRFIRAVEASREPLYYSPSEITPQMVGKPVRIVGGPLDGMTGNLLSIKGMRKRRLIVELPGMITSAVEVDPDFIQFV